MGQAYNCDICHEVAADFMITRIEDGTTAAVGVECLLEWAMPIAQAFMDAVEGGELVPDPLKPPDDPEDAKWEEEYPQRGVEGESEPPGDGTEMESEPAVAD